MIFSILDTELDGVQNKIGLFSKSLSEIFDELQSGRGVKAALFSPITNDEIVAITDYINLLNIMPEEEKGKAFAMTMTGVGEEAVKAADKIIEGKMSLDDLASSAGKADKAFALLKNSLLNFGAVLAITVGVELLVKLFDYLITTSDELKEAMDTAFSSFQSAQKNTETIRSELESINNQIDTLNAKGGLTIIEEGQLENLREAKQLAEMNLALAKEQEKQAAINAGESVFDIYKRKYSGQGAVTEESVKKSYEEIKDDDFLLLTDDISQNIAIYQKMSEELISERERLKGYLGKSKDEIYDILFDDFVAKNGYADLSIIGNNAADVWKSIQEYDSQVSEVEKIRTQLYSQWEEFNKFNQILLSLPEDYVSKLFGDNSEAYDSIKATSDFFFKFFKPKEWEDQKFNTLFDVQTISDAKKELVKYAAAQEGVGLTAEYLNANYSDLYNQIETELNKINEAYGTGFTIDNFIAHINSEAQIVDPEELERQVIKQVEEEFASGTEVEAEIKPKFTIQEYTDWVNALDLNELKAFKEITLTPNFVISDHTLAELDELIDKQLNATKSESKSFSQIIESDDGRFLEDINKELEKINTLKEAMKSFQAGEFDNAQLLELTEEFPDIINNTNNLMEFFEGQIEKIIGKEVELENGTKEVNGILKFFDEAIKEAGDNQETIQSLEELKEVVIDLAYATSQTPKMRLEFEVEGFDKLKAAIEESNSATGLSVESIDALTARYKTLGDKFNPYELFERTSNGISLNVDKLRELEKEYNGLLKADISNKIDDLRKQFNALEENTTLSADALNRERQELLDQIHAYQMLQSQIAGATSKYQQWINAQESSDPRDPYVNIGSSFEDIEKLVNQGWHTDSEVTSFLELLTGRDASEFAEMSQKEIKSVLSGLKKNIKGTKFSVSDFFTQDKDGEQTSEGLYNFLDAVDAVDEELGKKFAWKNKDGTYGFDFTGTTTLEDGTLVKNIDLLAERLGVSTELIELFAKALQDTGFAVDFGQAFDGIEEVKTKVEETEAACVKLGVEPVKIDINVSTLEEINSELESAKEKIQEIKDNKELTPEVKTAQLEDAYAKVDALVAKKNKRDFQLIDPKSVSEDMQEPLKKLQELQEAQNKYEAAGYKGIDTKDLDEKRKALAEEIAGYTGDQKLQLGLEADANAGAILDRINAGDIKLNLNTTNTDPKVNTVVQEILELDGKEVMITINAQFGEAYNAATSVIAALGNITKTITINAVEGEGLSSISKKVEELEKKEYEHSFGQYGNKNQSNLVPQKQVGADAGNFSIIQQTIDGITSKDYPVTFKGVSDQVSFDTVKQSIGDISDNPYKVTFIENDSNNRFASVNSEIESIISNPYKITFSGDQNEDVFAGVKLDISGIVDNPYKINFVENNDAPRFETLKSEINSIKAEPCKITFIEDENANRFISIINGINGITSKTYPIKFTTEVESESYSSLKQTIDDLSVQKDINAILHINKEELITLDQELSSPREINATLKITPQTIDEALTQTSDMFSQPEENNGLFDKIKNFFGFGNESIEDRKFGGGESRGSGAGRDVPNKKTEDPFEKVEDKSVELEVEVKGQEDLDLMIETIDLLDDHEFEVKASVLNQEELNEMKETHSSIGDVTSNVTVNTFGLDDLITLKSEISTVKGKTVDVGANVFGLSDVQNLADAIRSLESKTVNVEAKVSGTAHLGGTANNTFKGGKSRGGGGGRDIPSSKPSEATGTAYVHGNWGTSNSGVALGGELGQEIVVRDGKYFTIGDTGAEFFKYQKGDVIFNHEQSQQIFEHGRILHGQRRAKAFASGTAFSSGSPSGSGNGRPNYNLSSAFANSKGKSTTRQKSSGKDGKDKEEVFDWIEIAIDRIERAIDNLELKASSAFKSWIDRSAALKNQISSITDEIDLQRRGYERYMQEARSVGLSENWAKLVRDGAIDIDTLTDEDLIEKIKNYQEWYEKALDCRDAIDELGESLSECYQTAFDNVVTQYEDIVSIIEHEKSLLEESISKAEEQGYIASVKYYEALMQKERDSIEKLAQQRIEMEKALQEAVSSGAIVEKSEAWYEMVGEINDVTMSIEEANTQLIEYNNSIRDIEWEIFDLLQDRISRVAEETEFLVDLLGSDKLHKDGGQLTEEGMATMGLHGVAYNTYMEQVLRYAQELKDIESDIVKDPNNKNLLERRQELLEAQRDSILAAQDEKQAIVDLVEEGIDLELEALEKRIDKYNESIEAAKDLLDYQRDIAEQTKEISSLEKQMMAYEGDDSEETKAKVQALKVSLEEARTDLEETEYEHFIDTQEKMLDDLYTEYEELLNQRLDDIDALVSDMIDEINLNSGMINDTLNSLAGEFGYELSNTMKNTWNNSNGDIVTIYDQGMMNSITSATTTLSNELRSIDEGIWQMVYTFDSMANEDISGMSNKIAGYASGAYRISRNQLAWTQEGRNLEAIIRPSDGAILTPLARNDSVLNAVATSNLFDFANNPSKFIKDNLDIGDSLNSVQPQTYVGATYNNDIGLQIELPNVTDYRQFVYEMQHDPNFERMIRSMTVDRMFGGSPMNKYKH